MAPRKGAAKTPRKTATRPTTTADVPKTKPRENAAGADVPTYRVDRGEALPTPPIRTATDKK